MQIRKLIQRLQQYTPVTDYTVHIESKSIIITKHIEVDEIEVTDED